MYPSFEDFLRREERTQYVENPKKRASHDRCSAIVEALAKEYETEVRTTPVPGGTDFTLRLFTAPYSHGFNVLLAELIARCGELNLSPDPEDPCYILLSATVSTCDRILDGRGMPYL